MHDLYKSVKRIPAVGANLKGFGSATPSTSTTNTRIVKQLAYAFPTNFTKASLLY